MAYAWASETWLSQFQGLTAAHKIPKSFAVSILREGFGGLQLHFTYSGHCSLSLPPHYPLEGLFADF